MYRISVKKVLIFRFAHIFTFSQLCSRFARITSRGRGEAVAPLRLCNNHIEKQNNFEKSDFVLSILRQRYITVLCSVHSNNNE